MYNDAMLRDRQPGFTLVELLFFRCSCRWPDAAAIILEFIGRAAP
jgi:hypothetical protein